MGSDLKLEIILHKASDMEELDQIDQELLIRAQKATETAYAPYSGFRVGAAVLLEGNTIVAGSNQENASYPSVNGVPSISHSPSEKNLPRSFWIT